MNLFRNFYRVEKLHTLILQKKTGSPKQFAEQLYLANARSQATGFELW